MQFQFSINIFPRQEINDAILTTVSIFILQFSRKPNFHRELITLETERCPIYFNISLNFLNDHQVFPFEHHSLIKL